MNKLGLLDNNFFMNESVWQKTVEKPIFPKLERDIKCEVLVIGGGIAGILCAYFLKKHNIDVKLVEGNKIGAGITAKTTAVLTAQHDTLYKDLIKSIGFENTKNYLNANLEAVEEFANIANFIDCDFERSPSYCISKEDDLIDEVKALNELGYNADYVNLNDFFEIKSGVRFPNMGQFNPLKFLYGISKELEIYEDTFVDNIDGNIALTKNGKIEFGKVIIATHYPFINRNGYFFAKLYQKRSYVIAYKNATKIDGTYIDDTDRGLYYRMYNDLLIVGAGDARTGTQSNGYEEIRNYAKEHFPEATEEFVWSNQDCVSLDGIPYIGEYGKLQNAYVISGFNLWGMTNSMVGAKILCDLVCEKENKYAKTFDPQRKVAVKQLMANLGITTISLLKPCTKRCTHMGSSLNFNERENTWECRCHGSRFSNDGKLLDNPAKQNANI